MSFHPAEFGRNKLRWAFACTERRTSGIIGTVNVSVDFKDFIKWNFVREMLEMLKDHYPERLHRVFLVDAPVVFRALWSLIKPFVDPVTKTKFQFVTGESQRQRLFGAIMDAGECMPYQRPRSIWSTCLVSLTTQRTARARCEERCVHSLAHLNSRTAPCT